MYFRKTTLQWKHKQWHKIYSDTWVLEFGDPSSFSLVCSFFFHFVVFSVLCCYLPSVLQQQTRSRLIIYYNLQFFWRAWMSWYEIIVSHYENVTYFANKWWYPATMIIQKMFYKKCGRIGINFGIKIENLYRIFCSKLYKLYNISGDRYVKKKWIWFMIFYDPSGSHFI